MIIALWIAFGWLVVSVLFILYRFLCAIDSEIERESEEREES